MFISSILDLFVVLQQSRLARDRGSQDQEPELGELTTTELAALRHRGVDVGKVKEKAKKRDALLTCLV